MRETEIAILRERQKRLQIEQQIEHMKKEDEQIENEIEQLRRENARLAKLNAWDDASPTTSKVVRPVRPIHQGANHE